MIAPSVLRRNMETVDTSALRSELFDQANQESTTTERFSLHHRKTLRAVLTAAVAESCSVPPEAVA